MTEQVTVEPGLLDRYENLLRGMDTVSEEAALQSAYNLGRELLAAGLGVLDLAGIHRRVLIELLTDPSQVPASVVDHSTRLFIESLVPFEMTHRGFRDANMALRASEERYRELFENANDIIFTTDINCNLTSVNRAGELLTGYSQAEALTLNIARLLEPPTARQLLRLQQLKASSPDTGRSRQEMTIVASDGRPIPIEVSTRMIYDGERVIGIQGIARDITDRKRAESGLRRENQRLEEKARRIAHALHDEAGQLLASVYLAVAEIAGDLPRDGRQRLEELRALLDQVDDQIRHLAHELRPTILDDLGLVPACEFMAEGMSRRAGVLVVVKGSTGGRLPPDVEIALYRVVQEAVANATRHAGAQHVIVDFERRDKTLKGEVRDDGAGFDLTGVLSRAATKGLGLMGMRERLVPLGGTLAIHSNPGQGTAIHFEVPLEA